MWVNKAERAWRRRGELIQLRAAACQSEVRFAAFFRAVHVLLDDPEGCRWLECMGVRSRWCSRSFRVGKTGAEGLSVLEGVVLTRTCDQLLENAPFVRWMSQACPHALRDLHLAARSLVETHPEEALRRVSSVEGMLPR